jgi:enoyl-CoA hydratase/carnithine racemase
MQYVRVEREGDAAVLTIDNPPVNAIAWPVRDEIREVLDGLAGDAAVRVAILTGAGEKIFVAGADVTEFPPLRYETGLKRQERALAWWNAVVRFPKPLIAALNGHTLGGGLELALACDIRIAASHARLGLPETGLGILPAGGGTQRLARLVGPARAKDLVFTGRHVGAEEALEMGLADAVVPDDEVYATAVAMARKFAAGPPLALAAAKRAIDEGLDGDLDTGLALESRLFAELFDTEDQKIGMRSFLENGPGKAEFTGR